jgi:hypothetical protein
MMPLRKPIVAALAAAAALAVGAPSAGARTAPTDHFSIPAAYGGFEGTPLTDVAFPSGGVGTAITPGPCGESRGAEGQASTGGTSNQACLGAGLSFVGPSVGQVASVTGPTIIGPVFIGTSVVSAGSAAVGVGVP